MITISGQVGQSENTPSAARETEVDWAWASTGRMVSSVASQQARDVMSEPPGEIYGWATEFT